MKKKNDEKKKGAGRLLGYCPFLVCTGSRYNNLYHDTGLGRLAWAQGIGHDTAGWATIQPTTRLREATTRQATCARSLAGGECHDTKFCIVIGERGLAVGGCVTIWSLYRDRREVWLAKRVTMQTIVS